ncbi:MAG: hypothetical protein E7773_09490 [Sphingomonas sp.]|uniref:hypothetical protein n=1 Tax=Sphingomonas sp. TaxID=28214 RepID=UPI0011F9AAF4|nr:hypothetical protein [Sphingomonas sp.]THD36150.1 MAG: hypothetical protein E7773_09490 [Sphingomonas sp.]
MPDTLDDWPDDIRRVFAWIGRSMNGRRLSPEVVAIPIPDGKIIADHRVTVSHLSASELGQKRGRYVITITGKRIDGRWSFQPGVLEKLARRAAE